jgi:hypothetical protein
LTSYLGHAPLVRHTPAAPIEGAEADFLRIVLGTFLHVGSLQRDWPHAFRAELRHSEFLRQRF